MQNKTKNKNNRKGKQNKKNHRIFWAKKRDLKVMSGYQKDTTNNSKCPPLAKYGKILAWK